MFDYGDTIYRTASKTLLSKLDTLHHSAIRFATGAPYHSHHCSLYTESGLPPLFIRRKKHWYTLIYKTLTGKTPIYLSKLLSISQSIYNLRSNNFISLSAPTPRSTAGFKAFHYSAAADWNTLQKDLQLSHFISLPQFINSLDDLLIHSCNCF